MVKIIGIVAIVFVCNREINAGAEAFLHQNMYKRMRTTDADGQSLYTTKRKLEPDLQESKYTTKQQWGSRIQENSKNGTNIEPFLSNGQAWYNNLYHAAVEISKFKKYEKQIRDEIDDDIKLSRKPKIKKKHHKLEHKNHNSTEGHKHDKKRIDTEESHDKDRKYHEYKYQKVEKKYNDKRHTVSNNYKHSKHAKEPTSSYEEKDENMNNKNPFMNEHEKRKHKLKLDRLNRFETSVKPPLAFSEDPKLQLDQIEERAKDLETKERPKRIRHDTRFKKHSLHDHVELKRLQLRSTKMLALYQEDDETKRLKQTAAPGETSAPMVLSPYAIKEQMTSLMEDFPHANATFETLGRTVEYNDILIVKITDKEDQNFFRVKEYKYIDDVPEKKIIFLVHGLTVMGMSSMASLTRGSELKVLLSYYLNHLDKFDFYIIPLANPDGYSTAVAPDAPIWNKNVSPQTVCSGVCLDRNFDVAWNASQKISPCSQLFPGANAFSEIETRVIRDVFHRFGHKILAYIHVHPGTYFPTVFKGDAVLYPRGFTESAASDDIYIDIKADIDEAMKNASFRVMSVTVDTLNNWYGLVRGTSVDYAATVYGIPYAMEFVMQPYDDELTTNQALTEIWSRIIDITFRSMWKNLHSGSDAVRRRRVH